MILKRRNAKAKYAESVNFSPNNNSNNNNLF